MQNSSINPEINNEGNHTVPLSYNNDIDTTNLINIVLIHDQVYDYNNFFKYVNLESYPIIYNSNSSLIDLHNLLKEKFLNINRVSFIFHDAGINKLKDFINNEPLFTYDDLTDNVDKYSNNLQFIIDLVEEFNIKNLDYLACNTLQYDHWNKYYDIIHKETNVIIGASNDLTGNIKYGGNWILESTNEDIRNIYFTQDIIKYQYTLATTVLSKNGETYYFRQVTSTSLVEYSSDDTNWISIDNGNWPLQITNSSPLSSNILTVKFNTDITISSSIGINGYFIINSEYITINGNDKVITIDNITNYPGLIQNGTSSNNCYTNININDLGVVTSNNSTLADGGGWIGRSYFSNGISSGIISVTNCYSTGDIGSNGGGGGIFGQSAGQSSTGGSITLSNCYSTGNINIYAGGILGEYAYLESTGGSLTVEYCYSTGDIGSHAGGIFGGYAKRRSSGGSVIAKNCYSTGFIGTNPGFGGGIFGSAAGLLSRGGSVTAINCYSIGTIGPQSGGIFGYNTGSSSLSGTITSSNCYSIGTIGSNAGGIFGKFTGESASGGTITSSNCYSTGNIGTSAGGTFGQATGQSASGGTITSSNCYSTGNIGTSAGGTFGQATGKSASGGTITSSNCYSTGNIGSNGGGIFGSDAGQSSTGTTSITVESCYTIGAIATPGNGIFGSNKSTIYGTSTFCIYVDGFTDDLTQTYTTQPANIWVDDNATITIKRNDTTPSKWIDYSNTNVL